MSQSLHIRLACGVCASLLLACWFGCSRQTAIRDPSTHFQLREYQSALVAFNLDCGRYPTASEGLPALLKDPGALGWRGPYIEGGTNRVSWVISDEWGTPLRYVVSNGEVTVTSAGSDKTFGTSDDLGVRCIK
jgi:hypothetical protein